MLSQKFMNTVGKPYELPTRDLDFIKGHPTYNISNMRSPGLSTMSKIGSSIISSPINDHTLSSPMKSPGFIQKSQSPTLSLPRSLKSRSHSIFNTQSLRKTQDTVTMQNTLTIPSIRNTQHLQSIQTMQSTNNPQDTHSFLNSHIVQDMPRKHSVSMTEQANSVCSIYFIGFNYERAARSKDKPIGIGVLLKQNLILTASSVIPDQETARCSYAQFSNGKVYSFNYRKCLLVSEELSFTLIGIDSASQGALNMSQPLYISQPFELSSSSFVSILPSFPKPLKIIKINEQSFTFSSGLRDNFIPGSPLFTQEGVFQGIFITSNAHYNAAIRIDCVQAFLESNIASYRFLEGFLHEDFLGNVGSVKETYMYYFFEDKAWKFDIEREEWSSVTIRSGKDTQPLINRNHRLVSLQNNLILIIGGVTREGIASSSVIEYSPYSYYSLSKFQSMKEARDAPACLLVKDTIYALGGRPRSSSCEKYSLKNKRWSLMPEMFYGRADAAACCALNDKFIFVVGGSPLSPSGQSIERFSIPYNHWELLSVTLPRPNKELGLYTVNDKKIAILGGNDTYNVYLINIDGIIESDTKFVRGQGHTFVLEKGRTPLPYALSTEHSCGFSRRNNKIFIIKKSEDGLPSIVEFNAEDLDVKNSIVI